MPTGMTAPGLLSRARKHEAVPDNSSTAASAAVKPAPANREFAGRLPNIFPGWVLFVSAVLAFVPVHINEDK